MNKGMYKILQVNTAIECSRLSERELFRLLLDIDLFEVTRSELDSFDDSTFVTAQTQLPSEVANRDRMLRKLDLAEKSAQRYAIDAAIFPGEVSSSGSIGEPLLFGTNPSMSSVDGQGVAKLQHQMFGCVKGRSCSADLRELITEVYCSMFRRLPEDHVVVNPTVNAEFISRCRAVGVTVSEYRLNMQLMNARKANRHTGLTREITPKLSGEVMDRIGYASEISARIVTNRHSEKTGRRTSIDRMLCDPILRHEFDELAAAIAPGAAAYEYRLAALSYRKAGRQISSAYQRTHLPDRYSRVRLARLDPMDIPNVPGIYRFLAGRFPVFIGSTQDLRMRMRNHLAIGDGQLVPHDAGVLFDVCLTAELFVAPQDWRPRLTQAVANRVKTEQRPALNYFADTG